jgi:hypothetical protein
MGLTPPFGNWLSGLMVLFLLSAGAYANEVLKPFSAVFSVQRNVLSLGKLTLTFNLNSDNDYTYTAHTRPGLLAGLFSRHEVIEQSSGHFATGQIIPDHYTYLDRDEESENSEVRFDWPQLSANTTSQGVTWSQNITAGAQDKLSQQLQVRLHLAQEKRQISYQVADGGKLKTYQFEVDGEETIESPYGHHRCLRVKRSKESNSADYTIWFAPELGYLPIKIERTQGGQHYRMILDQLSMP